MLISKFMRIWKQAPMASERPSKRPRKERAEAQLSVPLEMRQNSDFEAYYGGQLNSNPAFVTALKTPLPMSFRVPLTREELLQPLLKNWVDQLGDQVMPPHPKDPKDPTLTCSGRL